MQCVAMVGQLRVLPRRPCGGRPGAGRKPRSFSFSSERVRIPRHPPPRSLRSLPRAQALGRESSHTGAARNNAGANQPLVPVGGAWGNLRDCRAIGSTRIRSACISPQPAAATEPQGLMARALRRIQETIGARPSVGDHVLSKGSSCGRVVTDPGEALENVRLLLFAPHAQARVGCVPAARPLQQLTAPSCCNKTWLRCGARSWLTEKC